MRIGSPEDGETLYYSTPYGVKKERDQSIQMDSKDNLDSILGIDLDSFHRLNYTVNCVIVQYE